MRSRREEAAAGPVRIRHLVYLLEATRSFGGFEDSARYQCLERDHSDCANKDTLNGAS